MHARRHAALPLQGWTLLSLRPRGQHGGLRAAAARSGARLVALSTQAIELLDDASARAALRQALKADVLLFTSPNAVRGANALQVLSLRRRQRALAVGSGTRNALGRLGIEAQAPVQMDSDGLLGMPGLVAVTGIRVGVVTGVGGRDLLAPTLRRRGAEVTRADTYCRVQVALAARAQAGLAVALASPERVVIALSSAEALAGLLIQLPAGTRHALIGCAVIAASPRLAKSAADAGFIRIAIAASARPAALLRAAVDAFV